MVLALSVASNHSYCGDNVLPDGTGAIAGDVHVRILACLGYRYVRPFNGARCRFCHIDPFGNCHGGGELAC